MSRVPSVRTVKKRFTNSVGSTRNLVAAVEPCCEHSYGSMLENPLHASQARTVIGLAFLKLVAAWEEFLEHTFVRYMAGAPYLAGDAPGLRMGPTGGVRHSYELLSGKPDIKIESEYLSWSEPQKVLNRAKLYFVGGNPYVRALQDRADRLKEGGKIRNRVAHTSDKARSDFLAVARSYKGLAGCARIRQGYAVGDLLLEKAVRHFGAAAHSKTFFEAFAGMYEDMVDAIVPE